MAKKKRTYDARKDRVDGAIRREKVMKFLREFWIENKMSPTTREIADGIGVRSTSVVALHVRRLIKDGRIEEYDKRSPRSLRPAGLRIDFDDVD